MMYKTYHMCSRKKNVYMNYSTQDWFLPIHLILYMFFLAFLRIAICWLGEIFIERLLH